MAIDVEIQDESGRPLVRYEGPALGLQFTRMASPGSACFRFVTPWGDTTFNEEQIKVLKDELKGSAREYGDQPTRLAEPIALSSFLEGATRTHVYVKFIGD